MVHPRSSLDRKDLAIEFDTSSGGNARERKIVRGVASPLGFLADSVEAVDNGRFTGIESKPHGEDVGNCLKVLTIAVPLDLPISVPYMSAVPVDPGNTRPRAIQSFAVVEVLVVDIAQSQMSEVKVVENPRRILPQASIKSFPEKSHLKPERMSGRGLYVPGIVPPLGLKIGVVEVVARKRILIARKSGSVDGLSSKKRHNSQAQRDATKGTPRSASYPAFVRQPSLPGE